MSRGYDSLIKKVQKDCEKGQNCFNPNGCEYEFYKYRPVEEGEMLIGENVCICNSKCHHKYCDKFKWVIDRAKHYAKKTGLKWEDILDSWEDSCNYWYVNYYQECNQPLIKEDKVRVFETVDEMLKSIGDSKFRCPACGGVSSNAYECNSGKEISKATKRTPAKVCDWKVYGLFGDLGKGTYVFCKDKMKGNTIFTPLIWEDNVKK